MFHLHSSMPYSEMWLQVCRIKTAYFNQKGKPCKFTFHP